MEHVRYALDKHSQYYEKCLLRDDFNAEDSEPCLPKFYFKYNVTIFEDKICLKSISNPLCIDFFITNSPLRFQNTIAISTGLRLPWNGSYCGENEILEKCPKGYPLQTI